MTVSERIEAALGAQLRGNNRRIARADVVTANPRPLDGCLWNDRLERAHPGIRDEWDAFVRAGGRLPLIEEIIDEHQGNDGPWRAGLLISRGSPVAGLSSHFPTTIRALTGVPGLHSALFSQLDAGTELPPHEGPNAGMLRYHLGIRCSGGSALRVADAEFAFVEGHGVLFDDTATHSAWNHGTQPRITLFCDVTRPLPAPTSWANAVMQRLVSLDHRYRNAPGRAEQLHRELNPGM